MSGKFDREDLWVHCAACGHKPRRHRVLFEKGNEVRDDPDSHPIEIKYHWLVECMGCEKVKYVIITHDLHNQEDSAPIVYPDAPNNDARRPMAITLEDTRDNAGKILVPEAVWKMYRETVDAFNANVKTLAAGGLRAVVEAICLDKQIANRNLQQKIDELAAQGFLTKPQSDLLHEERYLGNAALHELATPTAQDIEDGLEIVEGMIKTIYILPSRAERLKARRQGHGRP